jgi:hypothetical protein
MMLIAFSSQASNASFCKSTQDRNCFTGTFGLVSIPGDPKQKLLESDFGYIDSSGTGWQTNKGTKTDGASIPPLLQPFVGSPWEDGYIRAAVIHDWYCDRHVRSWKATHKVFYSAMIASGLESRKAKLMFYAVYAFGPRWGYLIPGTPCKATYNCIQVKDPVFIQIPSKLDDVSNTSELKAIETMIELTEVKGGLSLEELMTVADKAHPKQDLLDTSSSSDITQ